MIEEEKKQEESNDFAKFILNTAKGVPDLAYDLAVKPVATKVFGVEEEDIDYYYNQINSAMAASLPFTDADKDELIDPKTGKVEPYDNDAYELAELGTMFAGAGISKAVTNSLPYVKKLPETAKNIVSFMLAEQVVVGRDENLSGTLTEMNLKPRDGAIKDVIEFLATDKDDTALERRAKVAVEGLGIGAAFEAVMRTPAVIKRAKSMFDKLPSQLTPDERTALNMEYLKEAKQKADYANPKISEVPFRETAETSAQVAQQNSGPISQFVQQVFTSRGYWTTNAFNAFEDSQYAQRQVVSQAEHVANRLQQSLRSLGDEATTETATKNVQEALSDNLKFHSIVSPEGKIAHVAEKYNLPAEAAEEVLNARELIDDLSSTLANSNIPNSEFRDTILENSGSYIRRSYRLFEDGGYKPTENIKADAIDFIASQNMAANRNLTPQEATELARGKVDEILKQGDDSEKAVEYYSKVRRVNTEILKGRTEIPEPIRKLMGEVTEPSENILLTVSKLARLTETNKFFNTFNTLGNGRYVFDDAIERNGVEYVTKIQGTNSVLDGKYTTPEMLTAIKEQESSFLSGANTGVVGMVRNFATMKGASQAAKTVYSHVTHLRNVLGGMQFGVANGANPFTGSVNTFKTLANEIKNGGDKALDATYEKYLRLGIINTNVKVNEFRQLLDTGYESQAGTMMEKFQNKLAGYGLSKGLQDAPGEIYMAVDDFYKINNFSTELETLRKAFPDENIKVLEQEAAQIVQNTFPNYDRVPKGIKALRHLPVGNFVAFPTEMWRTSANIIKQGAKEIESGNPTLMLRGSKRLAGFVTVMAGWSVGANETAKLAGLTEEQNEAVQLLSQTPWSKSPNNVVKGGDGKLYVNDTQFIDSYSPIKGPLIEAVDAIQQGSLRGEAIDEVLGEAILNAGKAMLAPYTDESMLTSSFTDVYQASQNQSGRTAEGKLIFEPYDSKVEKAVSAFAHVAQSFLPGSVSSIEGIVDAALETPNKTTGEPKSMGAELATNLTGVRFKEFKPKDTLMYSVKDFNYKKSGFPGARVDYVIKPTEVVDTFEDRQKQEYILQQDLYQKVRASETLLGRAETVKVLLDNGFSNEKAMMLIGGYFSPVTVSKDLQHDVMFKNRKIPVKERMDALRAMIKNEQKMMGTRLIPAIDAKSKTNKAGRLQKAKGGEVNVPQAPREPDERIDKFTGKPYNEQAGAAFMDVTDPERRMKLNKGGYAVKPKDTLYKIAKDNNTTVEELQKLNNIKDPSALSVGQTLKVKSSSDSDKGLSKMIDIVTNKKKVDAEVLKSLMKNIADKETGGDIRADKTQGDSPTGYGRGIFQIENKVPKGTKGHPSSVSYLNRTRKAFKDNKVEEPEWLKTLPKDYDPAKLSIEQQKVLFLGNHLEAPRSDFGLLNKGMTQAQWWGKFHQTESNPDAMKDFELRQKKNQTKVP